MVALHEPTVGEKVLHSWEALDVVDLVEDREREDEQRERAFIKARGNGYTPLPLPTPPLPDYRS